MTRRLRSTFITVLAGALLAAGCTSDGAGGSDGGGESTLDKVIDRGEIRVAVLPDFPPFSVQNASGEFEGYEVDVAKALAEALDVELDLVSTDGASRLPLLSADRADVNISSWTATDERAKAVGFTIPYIADGASVLYSADEPIEGYEDLAGKSVSVARGSTNDTIMTEDFPDTEIVRFESIADAVGALKANQVDAAIEGRATVTQEAERNDGLEALDEPPLKPSLISMGALPGDQRWINYLNNFIRNLNASGTNAELYQEWFGEDLPDVIG
ncbi:transporter substrate-binding domain-containing protein [Aeromicrobium sp. CTD01-1L150]|uniref:transporter substrate-binding domain-containing protein n=1 Tax=Aeromicrobium sp. CTD01-1L150 TaxID=3341830 RepID=UPI0035C04A2E